MNGQHTTIGYLELFHGLGVVGEKATIVVDVQRRGRDIGIGVYRFSESLESHIGKDLEVQQDVLVPGLGVENIERDLPARRELPVSLRAHAR
ncbi:hypothetical protein E4U42_006361 [Claviceps africana]|uniref:Uncharacterized protein n=1 Tax=Claviceps africana TaxID=83212 RepID=A0A8K0JCM7_9HYPO|nr:hypothetical protein E4U42_006361 [Claviceps africana]